MPIRYYSKTEIAGIRRAGQVVMAILEELRQAVRPGVTTAALDALAVRELKRHGATSNFKGYAPVKGVKPFPGVICASVNEAIVHGIPGVYTLREGDIISLDFGAVVDGWHGDSAITVPVGAISPEAQRLLDVTREALRRGIAAARGGNRVVDISRAFKRLFRLYSRSYLRRRSVASSRLSTGLPLDSPVDMTDTSSSSKASWRWSRPMLTSSLTISANGRIIRPPPARCGRRRPRLSSPTAR